MDLSTLSNEELVHLWRVAKRQERAEQQERIRIEEALISRLGTKEEGSQTHDVGAYKVTVTAKLTYKADLPMLLSLVEQLPDHLRPIKTETKLDEAGAKYLRTNDPELWRLISPAVEVKPAKTALTIKEP